jgi:DNA-binding transcriptional regulator LsrR (DeoR family)
MIRQISPEHMIDEIFPSLGNPDRLDVRYTMARARYYRACEMRFVEGKTYSEIGQKLAVSHSRAAEMVWRGVSRKIWLIDPSTVTVDMVFYHGTELRRNGIEEQSNGTWVRKFDPAAHQRDILARMLQRTLDGFLNGFVVVPPGTHQDPKRPLKFEPWP